MQDTFTVPQDFRFAEYFNFSLYQMSRMKMIRRLAIYLTGLGVLVTLFDIIAPGKNGINPYYLLAQSILPLAVFVVLALSFAYLTCLFIVRFRPQIIRGITYRFTHWGMERIGAKTEATVPWRDFQNLKETKSFFLLFVKETVKENKVNNIHVIQKRMFANQEDARDFVTFLDHKLPL